MSFLPHFGHIIKSLYNNKKIEIGSDYSLFTIKMGDDKDEIPLDYNDKFRYGLNPEDLPWIYNLASDKNFPDIDEVYWTPPLLTIMDATLKYEPITSSTLVLNYIFEYIGSQTYILKHIDIREIPGYLNRFQVNRAIDLLNMMKLNGYMLVELYNAYKYECEDQSDEQFNTMNDLYSYATNIAVKNYLKNKINWGIMFLVQLNNWISREGSYQATEFVAIIGELWEKYENRIPQLQDPANKEKWNQLTIDPWKDEMHNFLYDLGLWA